jgi:hypothetical protein
LVICFPLQLGSYFFRAFDVLPLGGLVSTAQEKNDGPADFLEVNAITWAIGHPHLAYARSDGFDVTRIAKPKTLDAGNDLGLGLLIRKT